MPTAGITFTSYVPQTLVGVNSPSPTLATEPVTRTAIGTGAFPGNIFYLNEQQANALSTTGADGATVLQCHAGWYMVVQVAANAIAANIIQGSIGGQASLANTTSPYPAQAVVTDGATASTAGLLGVSPVIFLGHVTPGNYTIVQVAGDASVLLTAGAAAVTGGLLVSTSPGTASIPASPLTPALYVSSVGVAEQTVTAPAALTLTAASASSAGTTTYTGTITGGASNALVGRNVTIAGFTNSTNNGSFTVTASTATTLTVTNNFGVAETHAGTAAIQQLCRVALGFPFGVM